MQVDNSSDKPPLQTLSRKTFWQKHIAQWRDSGLSKMAYCQQYALVYHQMVYWCSKAEKTVDIASDAATDFVAVSVTPSFNHAGLCVQLPNGIAIEGIDERSVMLVGKLVEQL